VDDVKTEEPGSLLVAPQPQHPQDNWLELIGAGAVGGFTGAVGADAYSGVKAACRTAVEKFRDRQSDPDEEGEYMHQLVAEAFIGPCPPGHKLVHLNGDGLDNRRANLAYVPESDPRPAAPLILGHQVGLRNLRLWSHVNGWAGELSLPAKRDAKVRGSTAKRVLVSV
jgi:HNH endonuclease